MLRSFISAGGTKLSSEFAIAGLPVLIELRVENYAVIDSVVVPFGAGLNLLTGETGAGKSILIDALSLLLGEKASSDIVRHGTEKAVVSAVFEADSEPVAEVLEANGIDGDEAQIIVRREIAANGKSRVFINNQPATVAVLKQLAPHLAVIHAQNESVLAFDPPARLALLDSAAALDTRAGGAGLSVLARCAAAHCRTRARRAGQIADARSVEFPGQGNRIGAARARGGPETRSRKARAGQCRAAFSSGYGGLRRSL